jgi:hypothetical protein
MMRQSLDLLNNIQIASPCLASWDEMKGNDGSRHCSLCNQSVYNLSAMTTKEASSLLAARGESICVRLYRRTDGIVISRDCPQGVRTRISKYLNRIALAAASLFGVAIIAGCNPPPENKCWQGKPSFRTPENKAQIDNEPDNKGQNEKDFDHKND